MEYQDLRDWIQIADEMGELKTLKGCDWNLEIGAITEIVAHKEDGPAVLFEDIKGYPKGLSGAIQFVVVAQASRADPGPAGRRNQDGFRQDLERQLQEDQTDPAQVRQEERAVRQRLPRRRNRHVQVSHAASGMTKMAAATSAPAASISPAIRTRDGSTTAPTGS